MVQQKFSNDDGSKSDVNVFLTSIVPLQLISINDTIKVEVVVWKNPRPSSARFFRPIMVQFLHESVEATIKETDYVH